MRRYFEMEDPRDVNVLGVELRVSAKTSDGVIIRGIIDRLELDANGELVVTDYKTGSARRAKGWEQKSLAGVHIYSLLCERMFGRRPARVQLLYLSKPERIVTAPTDQSAARCRGEDRCGHAGGAHRLRARRLPARARRRCARTARSRSSAPSSAADPTLAKPTLLARQAEREGRPQLPLVFA